MMPQVHLLLPVVTSLKPFGFCPQAQPRLHSASRGPEGRRARLVDERVQEAERRFPGGKADAVEPREDGRSRGRRGRSACHALRATCHAMGPLREDLLPTGDRFQKQQRAVYRSQPRSTGSSVHRAPRCRGTCHSRPHTLKQTDHRLNGLLRRRRPMLSTAAEGGGRAARRTTHALCCSTVWPVAASPASCTRPPAPPQCENSRGRERKLKLTRLWVGRLGGCLLAVWS
jgi:hypothetical protein